MTNPMQAYTQDTQGLFEFYADKFRLKFHNKTSFVLFALVNYDRNANPAHQAYQLFKSWNLELHSKWEQAQLDKEFLKIKHNGVNYITSSSH